MRSPATAATTAPPVVDVRVTDGGSIVLLLPLTPAAREWFDEHLPADAPMLGDAVGVERRYVSSILHGLWVDGLVWRT